MTRGRAVTIKDVAAEAGVSFQTVSRVINKGPNVTEAVQRRVEAAVAKLGYVPNLAARRLGGTRSYLILALNDRQPTIEGWEARRGNDWIDQMLYGGMLEAEKHGYRMLFELIDSHSDRVESGVQAAVRSLHPDGVLLTPPHSEDPAIIALLQRAGIRFARIGSRADGPGFHAYMDDEGAARAAVSMLAQQGHRRIGFVEGNPDYAVSADRLRGVKAALATHGCDDAAGLIQPGDFTYPAGQRAMAAFHALDRPPTAVLAGSDEMALGVLHQARSLGIDVPRRLALVSFDDTPSVRHTIPPLTAIRQPVAAMTARAVSLLIAAASGGPAEAAGHLLPFELIERESTTGGAA